MGALIQEVLNLLSDLWDTANYWLRLAILFVCLWPVLVILAALFPYPWFTAFIAFLPFPIMVLILMFWVDPGIFMVGAIEDSIRRGLKWLATIIGFELFVGLVLALVPVHSNRGLVLFLILAALSLMFLAWGIEHQVISRIMKFLFFILLVIIFLFFFQHFLPKTYQLGGVLPGKLDSALSSWVQNSTIPRWPFRGGQAGPRPQAFHIYPGAATPTVQVMPGEHWRVSATNPWESLKGGPAGQPVPVSAGRSLWEINSPGTWYVRVASPATLTFVKVR